MACNIKQGLPLAVAQVLSAPEWKGGALVQLEDTVSTPKAEDIVLNQPWIFPFIKKFRDCVPSQFFAADAVLYLDQLYSGPLLVPTEEGDSKVSLAVSESKKIKLLIGALRGLWRSSALFKLGLSCLLCMGKVLYTHMFLPLNRSMPLHTGFLFLSFFMPATTCFWVFIKSFTPAILLLLS